MRFEPSIYRNKPPNVKNWLRNINMNIENEQLLDLSPLKIEDIDDTISELAVISEFEALDDMPSDLVDTIINLNI